MQQRGSKLIAAAVNSGKYHQAHALVEEGATCSNATLLHDSLVADLQRVPASRIVAYADDQVAQAYWNTISYPAWLDFAARGQFVKIRGVDIAGNVERQFDTTVVIRDAYGSGLCILRLETPLYVQTVALIHVIGRFREIGRFETAFGTRTDLPVFDFLYSFF